MVIRNSVLNVAASSFVLRRRLEAAGGEAKRRKKANLPQSINYTTVDRSNLSGRFQWDYLPYFGETMGGEICYLFRNALRKYRRS